MFRFEPPKEWGAWGVWFEQQALSFQTMQRILMLVAFENAEDQSEF
jgi:hypothetical protein